MRIDPRTQRISLSVVSTHAATLEVRVHPVAGTAGQVLFSGLSDGPRDVPWDGLLADGRLAPAGRYECTVVGRSATLPRTDSARVFFDIGHEVAPLEDTLPDLGAADLLPEVAPPSAATRALLEGLAVAGATVFISRGFGNPKLRGGVQTGAGVVAGAATISGIAGLVARRRHREVPANVAANVQRRARHTAENDLIRRRNAEKLDATVLVVTPAAGAGP
jgi:hypothetical protein